MELWIIIGLAVFSALLFRLEGRGRHGGHRHRADESARQFVGGTVYQAFLNATNYHRWHSPVAGKIVRAFTLEGTYYSEADSERADAVEPRYSQSYLAHVAARAVIIIEADNPAIGLTAFVPVGMSEVSSCLIDPKIEPGYHVEKGEELGYFQFGGSTHCLVFRPGAIADFSLTAIPQPHLADPPLVASPIEARHRGITEGVGTCHRRRHCPGGRQPESTGALALDRPV